MQIKDNLELNSGHSPIVLTLVILKRATSRDSYKLTLTERIQLTVLQKPEELLYFKTPNHILNTPRQCVLITMYPFIRGRLTIFATPKVSDTSV